MPDSHTGQPDSHTTPPKTVWDAWTLKRAELTGKTPEEIHQEREAGNKFAVDALVDYFAALRRDMKRERLAKWREREAKELKAWREAQARREAECADKRTVVSS
jgi:hypothetical protein